MSKILKTLGIYNTKFYEHIYSNLYVDGKLNKEKILNEISVMKKNHEKELALYYDTDKIVTMGNTYYNLCSIITFIDLSANITKFWGGFVEIDEKYIYSLSSGKWRYKGSNKWTKKYLSIDNFMNRIKNKEI